MFSRLLSAVAVLGLLLTLFHPVAVQGQEDPAVALLARMSPAARVGQLFIVTFPGTDVGEGSAIRDLILEDRVGGVLLRPENGNIVNEGDTPAQVVALTNGLQQLAWEASRLPLEEEGLEVSDPFVPLLIGVEQGGMGLRYGPAISGTTPLPSPMALGATWNPLNAETVGAIVGEELSALGFNLLLGPSLDVLDTPRPGSPADLGARSFGGDPYWVGRMGQAYIRGVHTGSGGRIAVVPGHFPGLGAADRPLSDEVSTVQKSLEQLKQIELAPFFDVVSGDDPAAQADGLLVSHIRYRGFQGNIYASTKPVSFDPQALQQLMALPELASWRAAGGVMVADELGVRAVRRFYDPTEQEFNGRRIAREAFVAGNDLLILSHFALTDDWDDHIANIRATIAFFREKYETDPTFQKWVDDAVLRILRLKLRLYGGSFNYNLTQVDVEGAAGRVGQYRDRVVPIAQEATTLLSPPSPDLRPAPPVAGDRIVIFTDDRQVAPCAGCPPVPLIPPTLLEETLLRLYGPTATRQVQPEFVNSFSFQDLMDYLSAPAAEGTPMPHPVEAALQQANWVLFAMLDATDQVGHSGALRRFLAERADLLRDKKVVVFAFDAPYYLDTTEISKLSAYFGLYGYTRPFIEAAARALFDEFPFTGDSPVSVAGINYSLILQTQPDPGQVVELFWEVIGGEGAGEGTITPSPTVQPIEVRQGDTLRLWTSVIRDRNGHPVPDGTPVEFIFTYPQEGLEHSTQVTTQGGVAETVVTLDRVGQLQVSVRAEPVPRAVRLEMNIPEGAPAEIVAITPTPSPTSLPTPVSTPQPTPELTPTPVHPREGERERAWGRVGWPDLGEGIVVAGAVALAGYMERWRRRRDLTQALQGALWCVAGGMLAYIGMALGLPGLEWVRQKTGLWAAGIVALAGAAIPLLAVFLADAIREGRLGAGRSGPGATGGG